MQPWYYRASMPKVNLNGTLTSPFFYADSDSASGAGQIDVLLMLYGSKRHAHQIRTCRVTTKHFNFFTIR